MATRYQNRHRHQIFIQENLSLKVTRTIQMCPTKILCVCKDIIQQCFWTLETDRSLSDNKGVGSCGHSARATDLLTLQLRVSSSAASTHFQRLRNARHWMQSLNPSSFVRNSIGISLYLAKMKHPGDNRYTRSCSKNAHQKTRHSKANSFCKLKNFQG